MNIIISTLRAGLNVRLLYHPAGVVVVGMVARCFALERYRVGAAVESSAPPHAFTGGATWPGAWRGRGRGMRDGRCERACPREYAADRVRYECTGPCEGR